MSVITDMVIVSAEVDDEAMLKLNAWCAENGDGQRFAPLDADMQAGGNKVFGSTVWAMCGNYFPWQDLAERFAGFGWELPENTVLIIDDDKEDETHVIRATGQAS